MNNKIIVLIMSCVAVLMTTGCSKKIVGNNDVPALVNDAAGATNNPSRYYQADWTSFKSGGHADLALAGKSLGSSMQMRMQRGKAIYLSLRPALGIEVAKMVICGDSILLVDKVHKRYILEKASLLTGGIPVTVDILQDIFLGRAFELGKGSFNQSMTNDFTIESDNGGNVILKPKFQFKGFEYNFVYDTKGNILSLDVTPSKTGASTYSVKYANSKPTIAGRVPTQIDAATKINGQALELSLEYDDMKWNEVFDIDATAPSKYKRIEAKDIMQIFGGGN